jgi:hypothetical protein
MIVPGIGVFKLIPIPFCKTTVLLGRALVRQLIESLPDPADKAE